jgi:hypothetical protein
MAGIFNKAYDQADRMLNGSGLSSVVYRQGGGRYSNRDEEFSDVEGYRPYRSKFRRGLQSLPSTAKMFINALTGKEDITDENVSKYFPKEELSVIAELPDKQEKLISEGAIRPSLGQKGNRRGQIIDRGPEAELLNYSERQTDKLLRPDIFEKYGHGEEGQKKYEEWWDKRTPILSPLMDLLQAPPRYNVANTLRKFYYGEPNLAGQRRIMDEYNYHYGKPTGSIQEALQFLTDPWEQKSPDAIKWLIETIGSRAEESGDDRKVKIDFNAPPPYKDGGWNFNPQTGEYIYDQGQGPSQQDNFMESVATDYADYHTGLKHGGQTMSRGLSGINKTININGQPHSLAWINPDEASALKAMGGSGKKVDGIPAYYFDDPGYMMEEIESYYDPVDHGTDFTPAPLQYGDVQYLSSDGQTTTPDRFGASGLTSNIPIDLSQADLTNEEAQALAQMHQSQVKSQMDSLLEGVPLSQEGSGRSDFKGLAQLAAQEAIPGASDTWDFEAFAENYPWIAPGALFVKGLGWVMGKDPNPIVSSYTMGDKIYNVYMDGTVKEQRKDEDYGDDGNEPVKKKFPLKKIAAAEKEEEKELTGIAKLLDKREKKPTEGEALQPQFDNIVAAGFSRQEAADMLNQPVNIFA